VNDDEREDERAERDGGSEDEKGSIPLLLSRPSSRPSAFPPPSSSSSRLALVPSSLPPAATASKAATVRGPLLQTTRLGSIGLVVAAMLVLIAVFADVLAAELPIACKVHGSVFLFPNVTQPPELLANGGEGVAREAAWSVWPLVAHGPARQSAETLRAPGAARGHPLGTDREGRDVFARIVHGTRSTLVFALAAVAASIALGAFFGGLAGLFGGAVDMVVGRAIETVSAFPPLVLVLGVQAAVPRPTLATLFFAIALTRWPEVARLVRAEVMTATTRDYALAARALGASPMRVLRRHVAPNVRTPLIVAAAVGISAVVLTEASLDFLRVGVPGAAASWGETMSQFRDAPHAWWLLAFPGLLLVATVIGHNLVGDALRDALDPRAH
jgi:peptide/nickel transport system permease protein